MLKTILITGASGCIGSALVNYTNTLEKNTIFAWLIFKSQINEG